MRPSAASTPSARGTSAAPSGGNVGLQPGAPGRRVEHGRAAAGRAARRCWRAAARAAPRAPRARRRGRRPRRRPAAGGAPATRRSPASSSSRSGPCSRSTVFTNACTSRSEPGRRLAAAGVHEAGEQRFAFHAPSLPRRNTAAHTRRLGERGDMTGPIEHLPPEDEADLVALADGSLYGSAPRRARGAPAPRARRWPPRSRASAAVVARLLATAPPAPLEPAHAGRGAGDRSRRRLRARAVAARGRARPGGRDGAALRRAAGRRRGRRSSTCWPSRRGRRRRRPRWIASFEGVRFPRYEKWRATGERTDVVGGRAVRTVFYERGRPGDRLHDRGRAGAVARGGAAGRARRRRLAVHVDAGRADVRHRGARWRRGRAGSAGRLVAPANCGWVGKRGFRPPQACRLPGFVA